MVSAPLIIASYPRSGSTWIRLAIASSINPDATFHTLAKWIPTIENKEEMMASENPAFYKTHEKRTGNVLHLVRHVGDVLISQYYYHRDFWEYKKSFFEFVVENDYGKNWREFVDWYAGYNYVRYEDIQDINVLKSFIDEITGKEHSIEFLANFTFNKMKPIDKKFIREGKCLKWEGMPGWETIIEKNKRELKLYGYIK